ncbi:MAG TPA: hypothetical protein VLA79_17540 [Polyangia bacterium]|nr:hypothetical protein [Polyangia bacterium]
MEETAFNPKRRLCPDGSCVGVLGPDGRCSVCQRAAGAGGESLAESPGEAWAQPEVEARGDDAQATKMMDEVPSGFDPARRLCDDGSCVGVVGADGVCGTCGRKAD